MIEDYSGPLNDKAITFLDSLKQNPKEQAYHALPEPKPNDRQIEISRAFSEHRKKFMAEVGQLVPLTPELKSQRRKAEFESIKSLLEKYPECGSINDEDVRRRFNEFY